VVVSAVTTSARNSRIIPEIQASSSCPCFQQTRNTSGVWLFLVEPVWQQSLGVQALHDQTEIFGLVYASLLGHLPQPRAGFVFLSPFMFARLWSAYHSGEYNKLNISWHEMASIASQKGTSDAEQ
jgi:hypothetical protein